MEEALDMGELLGGGCEVCAKGDVIIGGLASKVGELKCKGDWVGEGVDRGEAKKREDGDGADDLFVGGGGEGVRKENMLEDEGEKG